MSCCTAYSIKEISVAGFIYELYCMQEQAAEPEPSQASGAVPPSEPQVYSNGTTPQQAPRAASREASGDLLVDLMGTLAIEAPRPSAASTSPSDLLALEAPPPAPRAAAAAPGDTLALALLDEAPTQVQVCHSSLVTCSEISCNQFCFLASRIW